MASGGIKATFTLTLYDDDQVQVAQKKVTVENNPPEAQSLLVAWPSTVSGNAYVSMAATNSGGDIYPVTFQPNPGRVSVQVTTGGSENSAEEEKTSAPKKNPDDPFAGAEGTSKP